VESVTVVEIPIDEFVPTINEEVAIVEVPVQEEILESEIASFEGEFEYDQPEETLLAAVVESVPVVDEPFLN